MKKIFGVLMAVLAMSVFVACGDAAGGDANNANTNDANVANEEWVKIADKKDVVGTWVSTRTESGVVMTTTMVVSADYSIVMTRLINYAKVEGMTTDAFKTEFEKENDAIIKAGFVTIDDSNKIAKIEMKFNASEGDALLLGYEINTTKDKLRSGDEKNGYEILIKQK